MEDCHRKIILDNLDKLVQCTNYAELINACAKANIISSIMLRNIEILSDADEQTKHRALFVKLTKRGPDAYNKVHETLINLKYFNAAKILRPGEYSGFQSIKDKSMAIARNNSNVRSSSVSPDKTVLNDGCVYSTSDDVDKIINNEKTEHNELQIYTKDVPKRFDVVKSNKLYVDKKIEIYSMRTKENRGILFMVNIIDFPNSKRRNGADFDRDNMIHLFRELGFKIFYYENTTLKEFHNLLDKMLMSNHVKETECFILSLMTHGNMKEGLEYAEFHDGAVENLTVILDKFHNNVCKYLIRKPKVFIFPFCRGTISDVGIFSFKSGKRIESDGMDVNLSTNIPTYSDMLICYASVPGFKVHRDPLEGSWYIGTLCDVFAKHAHDTHVEDLLKIVGDKTERIRTDDHKLQVASFINYGFHKKLYFNPGYFDS